MMETLPSQSLSDPKPLPQRRWSSTTADLTAFKGACVLDSGVQWKTLVSAYSVLVGATPITDLLFVSDLKFIK